APYPPGFRAPRRSAVPRDGRAEDGGVRQPLGILRSGATVRRRAHGLRNVRFCPSSIEVRLRPVWRPTSRDSDEGKSDADYSPAGSPHDGHEHEWVLSKHVTVGPDAGRYDEG